MSVRRRTYRDRKTGAATTSWVVDIDLQHPDGRRREDPQDLSRPFIPRRGAVRTRSARLVACGNLRQEGGTHIHRVRE